MILDICNLINNSLKKELNVSHLNGKCDAYVVEASQVGSKMKKAIKDGFNATYLSDAEYVIGCLMKKEETPIEEPKDDEEEENTGSENSEENNDTEENNAEQSSQDNDEEVNESIKVQDLTKSMLSIPKIKKAKSCNETQKKEPSKKDDDKETDDGDKIEEAETEATGDKLKLKLQEVIRRALQIKDKNEKVTLEELPDFREGYDVFFVKLSFKSKKENKEKTSAVEN